MIKTLFILNDPPYGSERPYNALRLAGAMTELEDGLVRIFLIGDAVSCAKRGQEVSEGRYNLETMLRAVTRRGGEVGVCWTCMQARGILGTQLTQGTRRSTLDELSEWTRSADRILVF